MNPTPNQEKPLLEENGVVITKKHLSARGQTFEFSKIQFVRVEKASQNILAALMRRKPTFQLIVSTAIDATPFIAVETQDQAFLARITTAMEIAAKAAPHGRRTK